MAHFVNQITTHFGTAVVGAVAIHPYTPSRAKWVDFFLCAPIEVQKVLSALMCEVVIMNGVDTRKGSLTHGAVGATND